MKLIYWQLFIDAGLVVLIWMVQNIIYPAYHSIDTMIFKEWHAKYSGQITKIVAPLMLVQIGLAAALALFEFGWLTLIHFLLVVATWAVTFFISVPLHGVLNKVGKDPFTIDKLINSNWARTVLWTLAFALVLLIAVQQSSNELLTSFLQ